MTETLCKNAYLELIIGPMFSGKTSRLVDIYKQCKFCNIPVAVINHCIDDRYHETLLSTHDKIMIPCIKTDTLRNVLTNIQDAQVVIINEGQFFSDLYEVVLQMIGMGKKIYVMGG
jgi:thymidine kinase